MTSDTVILILSISGVNLALIGGILWKGATMLGAFQQSQATLTAEMKLLRERSDEYAKVLERTVQQLSDLESRVERLERGVDEMPAADRRRRPVRS